jgi:hypothetical protein
MSEALYFVSRRDAETRSSNQSDSFVIPAKAGIHHPPMKFIPPVMDPRLRGGDETQGSFNSLRASAPPRKPFFAPIGAGSA